MADFLPGREPELATWSVDFLANVGVIGATNLGLVSAQQTALQAAVDAFVSAYGLATNPATRTKPSVQLKSTMKEQMVALIRQLAGVIQKHPQTTDAQRAQLGLTVPRVPRPATAPGEPHDFKVMLQSDGSLKMTWKCDNHGTGGTMYQIFRRIGAGSEFQYIGGAGSRQFVDTTMPEGAAQVTYQVQGVRPTAVGPWAQFNVNFGGGGSGAMASRLSVTAGKTGTSPKIAA
ncbi:MAG TPA: hypothetical protein VGN72_12175 [Tepidisphaeraceae bacterium]|nr:hypothetical protein [Tepidisphaeraceae bacterium]